MALYPHVDGQTHGWGPYGSSDERAAVVHLLAELHASAATCRRAACTETFVLPNLDVLAAALDDLDGPWSAGPFAEPAAAPTPRAAVPDGEATRPPHAARIGW